MSQSPTPDRSPPGAKVVLAFAAIYFIWGSTFLAIRYAIETIPPFLMMGCRSVVAGLTLYGWARLKGAERPTRSHWASAIVVGALLFLGGHGSLAWGEQRVPSGAAALIMTTIPIWMTLLQSFRGDRLTPRAVTGLVLGFTGASLLVGPMELVSGDPIDSWGAAALVFGALSWSVGSIYSRGPSRPRSSTLSAAMSLLAGGTFLLLFSLLAGESVSPVSVSPRSVVALFYLIVCGSVIAFAAYMFLLHATTPSRVSTYAFVNPVIAVFLGAALGGESLSPRTLVATCLMVLGVAIIVLGSPLKRLGRSRPNADPRLSPIHAEEEAS